MVLIIVGAVVALLIIVGVVLAATGAFSSSSSSKPKPAPLTIPSTAATTPTAPPETTPTPTNTGPTAATKAAYIIQFDRVQRSYSKLVAALIRRARNPNSVQDIITAFKRLKPCTGRRRRGSPTSTRRARSAACHGPTRRPCACRRRA